MPLLANRDIVFPAHPSRDQSGPTRSETVQSEAQSYLELARMNGYWGIVEPSVASERVFVEPRALDSYQNVLFSILLFFEMYEHWPQVLTIVSHAFKRRRIIDLHCAAIRFPAHRVRFAGVNPPAELLADNAAALRGIEEAEQQWADDPGGTGPVLSGKRVRRNPHGISQFFFSSTETLNRSGLRTVTAEGGSQAFAPDSPRPWANAGTSHAG